MKYVLDSSVALKWAILEPDTAKAMQLCADYRSGVHELIAPEFFSIETAHSLTRAERQWPIPLGRGWGLWQKITSDCPSLLPHGNRSCHVLSNFPQRCVLACMTAFTWPSPNRNNVEW